MLSLKGQQATFKGTHVWNSQKNLKIELKRINELKLNHIKKVERGIKTKKVSFNYHIKGEGKKNSC